MLCIMNINSIYKDLLLKDYYPNEIDNALKIIHNRDTGADTIIVNADTQSGKTGTCPAISHINPDEKVLYTLSPSQNHLFNENKIEIFNKNPRVLCKKVHDLLKDDYDLTSEPFEFVFIDECHYGLGDASKLHKLIKKFHRAYDKVGLPYPCFLMVGATNLQLQNALNDSPDSLNPLLGRVVSINLSPGKGYYGLSDMLKENSKFNIHDPIDGMNELQEDGSIHPELEKNIDNVIKLSNNWDSNKPCKPIFIVRNSKNVTAGEDLSSAVKKLYGDDISTICVNAKGNNNIQESFANAIRIAHEKPVGIFICRGLGCGIRFPLDFKKSIVFVSEHFNVVASEIQGLVGRLTGYWEPDIGVNVYAHKSYLELCRRFSFEPASLNVETLSDLNLTDACIATHLNASSSVEEFKDLIFFFECPANIKNPRDIKKFVRNKYKKEIALASSNRILMEDYWNASAYDYQKAFFEGVCRGGDNRIGCLFNPNEKSNFLKSEEELKEIINTPNHTFTEEVIRQTGLGLEELIMAFEQGRLYRFKLQYPIDCPTRIINTKNHTFASYDENK